MKNPKIKFDSEDKIIKIEDWIAMPDNPIQRDTAQHARKALTEYLHVLQPPHLKVVAGRLDKKLYKADGHTRSYLWERSLLERPSHVTMTIYDVDTMEDLIELYKMFDNPTAAETPGDKLTGALRYHELPRNSRIWKSGGVTTALKAITKIGSGWKRLNMKDVIEPWNNALKLSDRLDCTHTHFPAPVFAAMVITVQRDKSAALTFWDAYQNGIKTFNKDGTYDPLYALAEEVKDWKIEGKFVRGSQRAVIDCVPILLGIYQAWARGEEKITKTPKPDFGSVREFIEAWIPGVDRKLTAMKEQVQEEIAERKRQNFDLRESLKEKEEELDKNNSKGRGRRKKAA